MMKFPLQRTTLILNLQALLLLAVLAFATSENPPIPKPDCPRKCGGVSIPFPFGTTQGCYRSIDFWVTCNRSSHKPPKLFLKNTTSEIKEISLLGQMTVMRFIAFDCYFVGNGTLVTNIKRNSIYNYTLVKNNPNMRLPNFLTVNNTASKFTVVGCNAFASVQGRLMSNRKYSTGCTASCKPKSDPEDGSCMGSGCCQISIPKNVKTVSFELGINRYRSPRPIGNCTFAFLVKESAYRFTSKHLTDLEDVTELPIVIDWAIGNKSWSTCKKVKQEESSKYACKSDNSVCRIPDNRYGYRCECKKGYYGNPYLDDGCKDIDECSSRQNSCIHKDKCVNTQGGFNCSCPEGSHGDGKKDGTGCNSSDAHTAKIVAGTSAGVFLLLLVASLAYLRHNRRQLAREKKRWFQINGGEVLLKGLPKEDGPPGSNKFKIFTFSELKEATNNFDKRNVVGQGGFGMVYKGLLSDKTAVAIKKAKIVDADQNVQFANEVIVISQTNHRNIVKLLGCCLEVEVPLLVYEFVSNGTLSAHLQHSTRVSFLTWEMRLKIAAETASVLSYLHYDASTPIIHRDVKSDNILLDDTFTAKVSDFGTSRLIALDQTEISTVVLGTRGYLDPEYLQTEQLTTKSDVFSFGVVLLELLTGRKALSIDGPEKERSLVLFSLSLLKEGDSFFSLIDGNILSENNRDQLMKVARLAERCLKWSGEERPDMNVVAMELKSLRVGRKQVQNEQHAKVKEPLPVEGFEGMAASGGSNASFGSDSLADKAISPPLSGRP